MGAPSEKYSISVVFPVYNEKDCLELTIRKTFLFLSNQTDDFEIICVNDGSTDGSDHLLGQLAEKYNIKVFSHCKNSGIGEALKTGFVHASKEIVFYTDVDLPCDLNTLEKGVRYLGEFDIIHGYKINKPEIFMRKIYSMLFNFIVRFLFAVKLRDINFAFLVFKREILNDITLNFSSTLIKTEFFIKACNNGYRIKEMPVRYLPRQYGISKFKSSLSAVKIFYEILAFWLNFR